MTNYDRTGYLIRLEMGMDALNINQRELAENIGVSRQVINQIKNGLMKGDKHIPKIADTLECRAEWLKNGTGEAPSWARDFEDFKKRLNIALTERDFSVSSLANAVSATSEEMSDILEGLPPGRVMMHSIAETLKVSYNWLAHGGGPVPYWGDHEEEARDSIKHRLAEGGAREYSAEEKSLIETLSDSNKNLSDTNKMLVEQLKSQSAKMDAIMEELAALRADTKSESVDSETSAVRSA